MEGGVDAGLATEQAPPPIAPTMTMSLSSTTPIAGAPVTVTVTGAPANAQLVLAIAPGGSVGAGPCPTPLAGGCIGIVPSGAGIIRRTFTSNAQGRGTIAFTIPSTVAPGSPLALQVLSAVGPAASNPMAITTAVCQEDGFENNDTPAAATRGAAQPLTARSCTNDPDYYGVAVPAGQVLEVNSYADPADGTISLDISDPVTSTVLDYGSGSNGNLTAAWQNAGAAASNVVISSNYPYDAGGPLGVAYDLSWSLYTPSACTQDAYDPNESSAAAITAGPRTGLGLCMTTPSGGTDRWDFYSIQVGAGQSLDVNLAFTHSDGDVDVYILPSAPATWDLAGVTAIDLASSTGVVDTEFATVTLPAAGGARTMYVAVYLYNDQPGAISNGNTYDMSLTIR
jgi:hypothetical protein